MTHRAHVQATARDDVHLMRILGEATAQGGRSEVRLVAPDAQAVLRDSLARRPKNQPEGQKSHRPIHNSLHETLLVSLYAPKCGRAPSTQPLGADSGEAASSTTIGRHELRPINLWAKGRAQS